MTSLTRLSVYATPRCWVRQIRSGQRACLIVNSFLSAIYSSLGRSRAIWTLRRRTSPKEVAEAGAQTSTVSQVSAAHRTMDPAAACSMTLVPDALSSVLSRTSTLLPSSLFTSLAGTRAEHLADAKRVRIHVYYFPSAHLTRLCAVTGHRSRPKTRLRGRHLHNIGAALRTAARLHGPPGIGRGSCRAGRGVSQRVRARLAGEYFASPAVRPRRAYGWRARAACAGSRRGRVFRV
jgi:hypothetical protein